MQESPQSALNRTVRYFQQMSLFTELEACAPLNGLPHSVRSLLLILQLYASEEKAMLQINQVIHDD